MPKEDEQWFVCEGEIARRVGVSVVFAWVRGCSWCRMCCFGVGDWRGRMAVREEERVIVAGCNVYDARVLR